MLMATQMATQTLLAFSERTAPTRAARRGRRGITLVDNDLVFTTRDGRPIAGSYIDAGPFREVCRKAGITFSTREQRGLRFHDLRHSAATILLAAGVPERVVMEILGHSTLAMVKRYQHVLPGLTVAAAERMDRVMGR